MNEAKRRGENEVDAGQGDGATLATNSFLDGSRPIEQEVGELISVSIHELRTPLSAVKGWAQTIDLVAGDDPLLTEALAGMQRGVQEQVELLACLEDLARLLRKKDQASGPIDLVDLVRGMVDDLRPSAAASQVELALVLPATSAKVQVTGVREPIKRALRSLVLQALRHSPRHSTIELRLCDESDGAVFIVTDKGEPPSNLAASHSVARLRRASMIGEPRSSDLDFLLAHASLVIRHNGGRMAAHPGPGGHGTVLVVTLPRAGSPASVE